MGKIIEEDILHMLHANTLLKEYRRLKEEEDHLKLNEKLNEFESDHKEELINWFLQDNDNMINVEEMLELRNKGIVKSSIGGNEDSKSSKSTPEFGKESDRFASLSKSGKKLDFKSGIFVQGTNNGSVTPDLKIAKLLDTPEDYKKEDTLRRKSQKNINLRQFSKEEIARHCTEYDTWIIFNGCIYDVSAWKNVHPGGKQILEKYAGKDCTEDFKKYHHWINPDGILGDKKVGILKIS